MCRGCRSGYRSVAGLKDLFDSFRWILSVSNLDQCSCDDTHHIVEESLSSDLDRDDISVSPDINPCQCADC